MKRVTNPLATGLTACLLLSACSGTATNAAPAATDSAQAAEPAQPGDANAVATPSDTPSPASASSTDAAEYDFALLTRAGAAVDDPRIVSTDRDHPCGPRDTVRVAAIPMDDPVFMPAYVVEFHDAGKELAKWGIPVEAEVVGLDGQRLQFQAPAGRFWVTPQGGLEKAGESAPARDLRTSESMFDCPNLPTFAESGAEQCFRVEDATGTGRRIALEGACS